MSRQIHQQKTSAEFGSAATRSRSASRSRFASLSRSVSRSGSASIIPTMRSQSVAPSRSAATEDESPPGHSIRHVAVDASDFGPSDPGRPLPNSVRSKMEAAFSDDFSPVRIHEDEKAMSIGAAAYTRGEHIHFHPGRYRPTDRVGQTLLAHELAHVLQQRDGRVDLPGDGSQVNRNPALETEADAMACKAIAGESALGFGSGGRSAEPAGTSSVNPATPPVQANGDKLVEAEKRKHEKELARFRRLQAAKDQGALPPIDAPESGGSASLSHLKTPYVDPNMNQRRSLSHGARKRFYTATPPIADDANAPPRRQISPEQVEQYKGIRNDVIKTEQEKADTHYAFYHAQDPRMRIAQDVYKRVYQKHHPERPLPEDFHFLRFPGPKDDEYAQHPNIESFFTKDMAEHGMIDDNINPTKSHIISANAALHGGLGHAGEETFHYFQIGQGQTELPVAAFMAGYLEKFGLDPSGAEELYERASKLNDTKEGSLFQIMVPKEQVDDVAYMAHPHGLPHDDELLEDLHTLGPIRYPARSSQPDSAANRERGLPPREKMNDEVTRRLDQMREAWQSDSGGAAGAQSSTGKAPGPKASDPHRKRLMQQTRELNERTLERFSRGEYQPSRHLEDYTKDPAKLAHPEGEAQKLRMQTNPEHFGGQGVRSKHEVMRVQNRANFMQARMLLSQSHMLNPHSGIEIKRHTTMESDKEKEYNRMLDEYVESLMKTKKPS